MMAGIRGRNTKPEMTLRRGLHRAGFRYRLHVADLPGKPDLVFPARRAAVFVHGCYWHRHEGCHWCSIPGSNQAFWDAKFESNVRRDAKHVARLAAGGWRIAVVWECALRPTDAAATVRRVAQWLESPEPRYETELVRPLAGNH
jgi:DNA mismatch endonuclease (patch repair protein)